MKKNLLINPEKDHRQYKKTSMTQESTGFIEGLEKIQMIGPEQELRLEYPLDQKNDDEYQCLLTTNNFFSTI